MPKWSVNLFFFTDLQAKNQQKPTKLTKLWSIRFIIIKELPPQRLKFKTSISLYISTLRQKDRSMRWGWKCMGGRVKKRETTHYRNLSFFTRTVPTWWLLVSASMHPNGTKYKSHPVPKISIGSAREMIRKWPVINKLQLGHDIKEPLPQVLAPSQAYMTW